VIGGEANPAASMSLRVHDDGPTMPEDLRVWAERLRQARSSGAMGLAPGEALWLARAPGRLDVMGGIADYSGSRVLEMPIREAACAAVQPRPDGDRVTIHSEVDATGDGELETLRLSAPAERVRELAASGDWDAARRWLEEVAGDRWASYVLGPVMVLCHEAGRAWEGGLAIALQSEAPLGKGVSSSAAVEAATIAAASAALGVEASAMQLARWCQQAENRVAGAPCGVMDQVTVMCGAKGALLELRCQPATIEGLRSIPEGLAVWGVDSGVRHAVGGSDYGSVRTATFMGRRLIEAVSRRRGDDPPDPPGGYLAELSPSRLMQRYMAALPASMSGQAFLDAHGETGDPVTRVDPDRHYAVAACTAHPVWEHHRVRLFARLLDGAAEGEAGADRSRALLGELMLQAHASYSGCGLGSDATDALVDAVTRPPASAGLLGAKITGGGSGGVVAILGRADAEPAVRAIAEAHRQRRGGGRVFHGSSDGAAGTGVYRLA